MAVIVVGVVLFATLRSAYADDCDDLARAGGASDAADGIARLTAIIGNAQDYSEAQRSAAQNGLNSLQDCIAKRSGSAENGAPTPVTPESVPRPNTAPIPQPNPSTRAGSTDAASPTPVDAATAGICADTAFVTRLGTAQDAFLQQRAAAQRTLQDGVARAAGDRTAMNAAREIYTAALRQLIEGGMTAARPPSATVRGDGGASRILERGPRVLANVPLPRLEALGDDFTALCHSLPASSSSASPLPPAPEHPVWAHFYQADTGDPTGAMVRAAGSTTFEPAPAVDLAVGDTIRASHGRLRIQIVAIPVQCPAPEMSMCLREAGTFYLDEGSEVTIERVPSGGTIIAVRQAGRLFVKDLAGCDPACPIIETGTKWIIPKGTEYIVDRTREGILAVTVIDGAVLIQDRRTGAIATIAAGQRLSARDDAALDAPAMAPAITTVDASLIDRWWERASATPIPDANEQARARPGIPWTWIMIAAIGSVGVIVIAVGMRARQAMR